MVGAQAAASDAAQGGGGAAGGAAAAAGVSIHAAGAVNVAGYDSNTDDFAGSDGDDSDDGSGHDLEGEDAGGDGAPGSDGGAVDVEERNLARAIALSRAQWEVSSVLVVFAGATALLCGLCGRYAGRSFVVPCGFDGEHVTRRQSRGKRQRQLR